MACEQITLALTVNGKPVERRVPPRMLLSDFLRHELHLTGPMSAASTACAAPATSRSMARPRARA